MQCIERSEATLPRLRRASRGHKSISAYQDPNIACSNYESQGFTWVIIFCFLLNFLASALDSVTAFVFPDMKVSKHEERIDDTQDHLPAMTKYVLISCSAFPKALAASFWKAYDQTTPPPYATTLAGSISSQMVPSPSMNGTICEQVRSEALE